MLSDIGGDGIASMTSTAPATHGPHTATTLVRRKKYLTEMREREADLKARELMT